MVQHKKNTDKACSAAIDAVLDKGEIKGKPCLYRGEIVGYEVREGRKVVFKPVISETEAEEIIRNLRVIQKANLEAYSEVLYKVAKAYGIYSKDYLPNRDLVFYAVQMAHVSGRHKIPKQVAALITQRGLDDEIQGALAAEEVEESEDILGISDAELEEILRDEGR